MTNIHPLTGVRYGVIAAQSLDPDVLHELLYGPQARDLSHEDFTRRLQFEIEREADMIEEAVGIAADEVDAQMPQRETWIERRTTEAYEQRGYPDRESYIDGEFYRRADNAEIDEPVIGGIYEDVHYQIGWLGGAQLLWVLQGTEGWAKRLCSPCVPNAADLDGGFDQNGLHDDAGDFRCYVVPKTWLAQTDNSLD